MSRRLAAVAALAVALAAPAALQAQSPLKFGLTAGATFPQGDAGDAFDWGYHFAGHVTAKPMLSPVGVRAELMYHSLAAKEETGFGDENLGVLAGLVNAEVGLGGVGVKPYLIGGLGFYRSTFADFDAETDFGFNIGAGLDFGLAGFSAFAEARYHSIQTEGESTNIIPVSFGIRF